MVRTGRKRKDGPRYPSGDLKPEDMGAVAQYARLKLVTLKEGGDPRHGSPLGRLHYEGKIVDSQRAAGEEFAQLVHDHRRIGLDSPSRTAKPSNMEPHIPGSSHTEYASDRVEKLEKRYDDICRSILDMRLDGKGVGVRARGLLHDVCADDKLLEGYRDLMILKAGLDRLCAIFGLTGVTKFGKGLGK